MDDSMEIVKIKQKELHFYIFKLFQQGIQLNNNCPNLYNAIFKQIQNLPG
jgi:hypothetical protein